MAAAAAIVPRARDFNQLVAVAFLLGLAGSSFAVGRWLRRRAWFPPEQQGTALGIYGLGNMGHSAAVFLGPGRGAYFGRDAVFCRHTALLCAVWAVVFFALARNAPRHRTARVDSAR